jgi:intein/homing endonuclease
MTSFLSLAAKQAKSLTEKTASDPVAASLLKYSLDADREKLYSDYLFPKSASNKKARVTVKHYGELIQELANISAGIENIFAALRYTLQYAKSLDTVSKEEANKQLSDKLKTISDNISGGAVLNNVKLFHDSLTTGKTFVIKPSTKYKEGYDIIFSGLTQEQTLRVASSDYNNIPRYIQPNDYYGRQEYEKAKNELYNTDLSLKAMDTARSVLRSLFKNDGASNIKDGHKRLGQQLTLAFDFKTLNHLIVSGLGISGHYDFIKSNIASSIITSGLGDYISLYVMRNPLAEIVDQHDKRITRIENGETLAPIDNSQMLTDESILFPHLSFSIVLHIPKDFAHFITQTPEDKVPALNSLFNWVRLWSAVILKRQGSRTSGEGKFEGRSIKRRDLPRYILKASSIPTIPGLRTKNGHYVEPGRSNDQDLFIANNGTFQYCPKSKDDIAANAEHYEKDMDQVLQTYFDLDIPVDFSRENPPLKVFNALHDKMVLPALKEQKTLLEKHSGKLLAYTWDYDTILAVGSDPSAISTSSLIGSVKPPVTAIADYLGMSYENENGKYFGESMAKLLASSSNGKDRYEPKHFDSYPDAIVQTKAFNNILNFYSYLAACKQVPDFPTLIEQAAKALNLTTLSGTLEDGLYFNYISNDLKFKTLGVDALDRTGEHIKGVLTVVLQEAQAGRGSALRASLLEELGSNEAVEQELPDHPKYFNVKTSRLSDFGNLYNYLGGKIFHLAMQAILDLPKAKILSDSDYEDQYKEKVLKFPSFNVISKELMPLIIMFSNYVPNSKQIIEDAQKELVTFAQDSSITADDIHIPGLVKGTQAFPHQIKTQSVLRQRPKFAILDISPGGGKCLVGSSLVPTASGLKTLKELWNASDKPVVDGYKKFNEDIVSYENGIVRTSYVYKTKGTTYKVYCSNGECIEGLPEHRMLVIDSRSETPEMEFVRLDKLRAYHWLPKAIGTRMFSTEVPEFDTSNYLETSHINTTKHFAENKLKFPIRLSSKLATVLGLLTAEGHIPSNKCGISFTNHDEEIMTLYLNYVKEIFNINIEYDEEKKSVGFRNQAVKRFIRDIIGTGLSAEREIPYCIRTAPEKYQLAFLRGMYEGDGSIYAREKSKKRYTLEYCTISRKLAYQTKSMLENIGIFATIKRGKHSYYSNNHDYAKRVYLVYIPRSHHALFQKKIGFLSTRKQSILEDAVIHVELNEFDQQNTNNFTCGRQNLLPIYNLGWSIVDDIRTILSKHCYEVPTNKRGSGGRIETYTIQKVCRDAGIRGLNTKRVNRQSSNNTTNRYFAEKIDKLLLALPREAKLDVKRDQELQSKITNFKLMSGFIWTQVVSAKENKRKTVYDLSVPGPHNYVVNGCYGHNTSIGILDSAACVKEMKELGVRIKPLIIAPDGLIKTWCDDLVKFLGANWNVIPINTAVYNRWGQERLEELLSKAPENTIVVTGLNFLKSKIFSIVLGSNTVRISGALEFVKRFGFNYILLDESHKAKNVRSLVHITVKQLTTASHVRFIRLATGTLISNTLTDIVGQTALISSHVFRTPEEYEAEYSNPDGPGFRKDTPRLARQKLSRHAAVITMKRKEWAFMLPNPIESFIGISLVDADTKYSELHQEVYNAVLDETLSVLADKVKEAKTTEDDDEEDDEGSSKSSSSEDQEEGEDLDMEEGKDQLAGLEGLLRPYLQRLERIITDPLGDPLGQEIFKRAGVTKFVSRKVRKITDVIRGHFDVEEWNKSKNYRELDLVSYKDKLYLLRKVNHGSLNREVIPNNQRPPDVDTDSWKEEPKGKVLVFCRYTRSVTAIFDALPPDLQKRARKFTGDEGKDKWANLEDFKKNPNVEILVANEQAMTEGHNLQIASRICRVENPWAPGDLEQAAARIFRPDPTAARNMAKTGKPGELYRELIYLDWFLAQGTMEVSKFGRLIQKIVNKTKFDEADNGRYNKIQDVDLEPISMSLDFLRSRLELGDMVEYTDAYATIKAIEREEFSEMRRSKEVKMHDLPEEPNIPGAERIDFVPLLADQVIPDPDKFGLVSGRDFINQEHNAEYRTNPKLLIGLPVKTEFGNGTIVDVKQKWTRDDTGEKVIDTTDPVSSVSVRIGDDDQVLKYSIKEVWFATDLDAKSKKLFDLPKGWASKDQKDKIAKNTKSKADKDELTEEEQAARERKAKIRALREAEQQELARERGKKRKENQDHGKPINADIFEVVKSKDKPRSKVKAALDTSDADDNMTIDLNASVYNGFLTVAVDGADPDHTKLSKLGFRYTGPYAYVNVKNGKQFNAFLDYIETKFVLSKATEKRMEEIQAFFDETSGYKFNSTLSNPGELNNFFRTSHRMVTDRKEIKVYPVVLEDHLMLTVDIETNPSIKRHLGKKIDGIPGSSGTWTESAGASMFFAKNKAEAKQVVKTLKEAGFTIENDKQFLSDLNELQFRKPRGA